MKSLVIGYCICAKCGWTNNKFNWHTSFNCPVCGSHNYVKPDLWGENNGSETKEVIDDRDMLAVSDGYRKCDLPWLRK